MAAGRQARGRAARAAVGALMAAALAACGSAGAGSVTGGTVGAVGAPASGVRSGGSAPAGGAGASTGAVRSGTVTAAGANWSTYDRVGARSGLSVSTPAFTSAPRVRRSWTGHVDGAVYGQPLVVGRDVVVATENNSVYAFDSATGRQVWARHLAPPVTGGLACGDILPSGITGTPVADAAADRLYVVTFSPYRHQLWSLDLRTGRVVFHRGVDGPGSDPRSQQERGALTIAAGKVFVPYGGLAGDCSDYHGWVVGIPESGRGGLISYVTPTQREAGIWSPGGAAAGHDSLYVATGNGSPVNAVDNSDSVVRLGTTALRVRGTFTPSDYADLSATDTDLGSTSPALLPDNMVFEVGKQGLAYIIDPYVLGRIGGQRASLPVCGEAIGGDAFDGLTVVVSCSDGLHALQVTPPTRSSRPRLRALWAATGVAPGPPIIAGGVVWDVTRADQLVGYRLRGGRLVYATGLASVVTSFPSLSASRGQLFVPEGSEVVAYRGI